MTTVIRACGHTQFIGTCPACQRAELEKHRAQLAEAVAIQAATHKSKEIRP